MKISQCIECGLCNGVCPVFLAENKEKFSPRTKVKLVKLKTYSELFSYCTLCGNCSKECPLNLDLDFSKYKKQNKEEHLNLLKEKGYPYES